MNETKLVRKAQQGHQGAFEELFEKYQGFVWNVVYRMTYDFEESEDMAQEVFVTVWKSLKNFRGHSAFSTWLYRIAVNKTLNRLRSKKSFSSLPGEQVEFHLDREKFLKQNPETTFNELEGEKTLAELLGRLDPDRRLAIILRELEELSYEEIAKVMDTPIGTVRSRIARAKKDLMALAQATVNRKKP